MDRTGSFVNGQEVVLERPVSTPEGLSWTSRGLARLAALAMIAGVVVAALGPFGTYGNMSMAERFAFWEVVLVAAAAIHIPSLWLAERIGRLAGVPVIFWVIGAASIATMPSTFIVTGVVAIFYGTPRPPDFLMMFGYVLTISVPMQALSYATLRMAAHPEAAAAQLQRVVPKVDPVSEDVQDVPARTVAAPIWQRVPASLGTQLICLEMQDHYVRIHTAQGSTLVLMRMSDAEHEIGGVEGARVHRSWWVARDAVLAVERDRRTVRLALSNGMIVPVSRERLASLRAGGWLER